MLVCYRPDHKKTKRGAFEYCQGSGELGKRGLLSTLLIGHAFTYCTRTKCMYLHHNNPFTSTPAWQPGISPFVHDIACESVT